MFVWVWFTCEKKENSASSVIGSYGIKIRGSGRIRSFRTDQNINILLFKNPQYYLTKNLLIVKEKTNIVASIA
jgi:hypothetical protein